MVRLSDERLRGAIANACAIDVSYERRLRRHLLKVLGHAPQDFCELVFRADGAYPTDVQRVLRSLLDEGLAVETEGRYAAPAEIRAQSRMVAGAASGQPRSAREQTESAEGFADPHPADYDWRYASSARARLTRLVTGLAQPRGKVALFGARTLFPEVSDRGVDVTLFERNGSLLDDLRLMGYGRGLVEHDLFDEVADMKAQYDVVVADPPWYPAFYSAFLLRAAEALRMDGVLLLSVLPWLTRPAAIEDRADVLAFALTVGFDFWKMSPKAVTYDTPKFELASLASEGICCSSWRAADLCWFRKVREPPASVFVSRPEDESEWDDFRFGKRKVKLRRRGEEPGGGLAVRPAAENGPVLPSVSHRATYRSNIDLWTSDNVAYSVRGIQILRHALQSVHSGQPHHAVANEIGRAYSLSVAELGSLSGLLEEMARVEIV